MQENWDSERSIPDYVGLFDLEHHPEFVEKEVDRRLRGDGPLSLGSVLWPKPRGGFRSLAVLDPIDEIAMRVAVTPIVHTFHRSLDRRVYSGLLQKGGSGWHFQRPKGAWKRLRSDLTKEINGTSFSSLLRTDVASFYPSISSSAPLDLAPLCDPHRRYLPLLQTFLEAWRADGLTGLPIGPEVSFLLANIMLSPVDELIDSLGYRFARYTDDILVLNVDPSDQAAFLEEVDTALANLDLSRSIPKTDFTTVHAEAIEWVNDALIASALNAFAADPWAGERTTKAIYEIKTRATNPDPSRLSFALQVFKNRGDGRAVELLIQSRRFARLNPSVTGEYLKAFATRTPAAIGGIGEHIRSGARSNATDLHLLRAAAARSWGHSDGRHFRDIVLDDRTPAVNRGWAIQAWSQSKDFDASLAADIAIHGEDTLARAACISLRRATRRTRRLASRHVSRLRPSLTHTCRWVRAQNSTL